MKLTTQTARKQPKKYFINQRKLTDFFTMSKKDSNVQCPNVQNDRDVARKLNRAEVLGMFQNGYKPKHIAQKNNVKLSSIYKLRARLIKDKLMDENNTLTSSGNAYVHKFLAISHDVHFFNENNANWIDVNKLHVTIKILGKPKGYDYRKNNLIAMKVRNYKQIDLKHHYQEQFYITNIGVRTNVDSVEIFLPEKERIIARNRQDATRQIFDIIFDVKKKVENLYPGLQLTKENYLNLSISENEYELIKNELAKIYKVDEEGEKFKVFDTKDGKVRVEVDFSPGKDWMHGRANLEAKHYSKASEDIGIIQPLFDDLGNKAKPFFREINPREREHYVQDMIDNKNFYYPKESKQMFDIIIINQKIQSDQLLQVTEKLQVAINVVTAEANNIMSITQLMKAQLPKTESNDIIPKEKPDYFG